MDSSAETSITSSDESINQKRFLCSYSGCSKRFTKKRKLINHTRLHSGERPFICDVPECNKSYTNSSHLRRHKKATHEQHRTPMMCTVDGCGRELISSTNYKKHMDRFHNPNKIYPFTCSECQQGFYRKRQLQQHSYLHTGELPFSCDHCNAKFLTIRERSTHKRIHKTYTCECGDICDKWSSLLAHKKICKLKNFKCKICYKTFSNKPNLKMHVKTHLDREDRNVFVCPYDDCTRYYLYKTNLMAHINSFHKKVPRPKIRCTYEGCDKLLSKMQNYKNHLRTHEETKKPKRPRKPRKDKGIPKQSFIEKLFFDASESQTNKCTMKIQPTTDVSKSLKDTVSGIDNCTEQTIVVK